MRRHNLLITIENNDLEGAKEILERTPNQGAYDNGAIFKACASSVEMVKLIHSHGADVSASYSETIAIAINAKKTDIVRYLCANGASIDTLCNHDYWLMCNKNTASQLELLNKLTEPEDSTLLLCLLESYLLYSKITPREYINTCPQWHKPHALSLFNA